MADVKIQVLVAGDGITYPRLGNRVNVHYVGHIANRPSTRNNNESDSEALMMEETLNNSGSGSNINKMHEFDNTRKRNKPFEFVIGHEQVFPGLDYAVSQLSLGQVAQVEIPPSSAFGNKGIPGLIPPKSTLMFVIELLSID